MDELTTIQPTADTATDSTANEATEQIDAAEILPLLESELGPGVAEALARTADQLQEDEMVLSALAKEYFDEFGDILKMEACGWLVQEV